MKEIQEPQLLQILRCLYPRMDISFLDFQQFQRLEKGFEGERKFIEMIQQLNKDWILLYDLLLEYNQSLFQLDIILITGDHLFVFDVKNLDGEYYIEDDNWYTISNMELKNPIHQLNRSVTLLRRFLHDSGIKFSVTPYIVFINPEFTLYQEPRDLPIILPTKLPDFLRKLQMIRSSPSVHQKKIAEKLVSSHIEDSPYFRPPDYSYEQLKKGIVCKNCQVNQYDLGRTDSKMQKMWL